MWPHGTQSTATDWSPERRIMKDANNSCSALLYRSLCRLPFQFSSAMAVRSPDSQLSRRKQKLLAPIFLLRIRASFAADFARARLSLASRGPTRKWGQARWATKSRRRGASPPNASSRWRRC
eukprot:scaffold1282_cov251-Pinguiococcus_pyrenoidosus.AAC.15